MRHFLIDGYNLLHKISQVKKSASPQNDLIYFIRNHGLTGSIKNKVTIFFDGSPRNEVIKEREFQIRFSFEEKADQLIMRQIERTINKATLIVISDDREIIDFSKKYRVECISTREFQAKADKPERISSEKNITYADQRSITEELKKIWLKE